MTILVNDKFVEEQPGKAVVFTNLKNVSSYTTTVSDYHAFKETVAMTLDKTFGKIYKELRFVESDEKEITTILEKLESIVRKNELDTDIAEYLCQFDAFGHMSVSLCQKVLDLMSKQSVKGKDIEKYLELLKQSAIHKRRFYWRCFY